MTARMASQLMSSIAATTPETIKSFDEKIAKY